MQVIFLMADSECRSPRHNIYPSSQSSSSSHVPFYSEQHSPKHSPTMTKITKINNFSDEKLMLENTRETTAYSLITGMNGF